MKSKAQTIHLIDAKPADVVKPKHDYSFGRLIFQQLRLRGAAPPDLNLSE